MSTITKVLENDASITYSGAGWSRASDGNADGGWYHTCSTIGSSLSFPFTGRALYLETSIVDNGGYFTATIDGVAVGGFFSCDQNAFAATYYCDLLCIARGLADTAHTLVLTLITATPVIINALVSITGALTVPIAGNYLAIGDSWTVGTGVSTGSGFLPFTTLTAQLLAMAAGKPVTLTNDGVTNASWFTKTGPTVGGHQKLLADLNSTAPQYLTMLFGANDLILGRENLDDFCRAAATAAMFVEDVMSSACTYSIGTPGYTSPSLQAFTAGAFAVLAGAPFVELAVAALRKTLAQFPRCRIASIYEAMDGRGELVYPNNQGGDYGQHPNTYGHAVIATEFVSALLGY